MGSVWLIVLLSLLLTIGVGYGLHSYRFNAIRAENNALVAGVRERIADLSGYRAALERGGLSEGAAWLSAQGTPMVATTSGQ
jgi:hypothetical protein